jgi:hypothetical protein
MCALTFVRANKSRPSGEWSRDDYDVYDGDRVIGRIFLHPQAPAVVLVDHGGRSEIVDLQ